jgi:hypothetical protein
MARAIFKSRRRQPALATLVFGDEGMGLLQAPGKIMLGVGPP